MHTWRNFSEKDFAKLKNFHICGNKFHKRQRLSNKIVADKKI